MSEMPQEPRIPMVTDPDTDQAWALRNVPVRDGKPLNLFSVLAHHPELGARFFDFARYLIRDGVLDHADRELAILRVAVRTDCEYQFGQHVLLGRDLGGLTDREVAEVRDTSLSWAGKRGTLLAIVDEIVLVGEVDKLTWEAAREQWNYQELIELVVVISLYVAIAMVLKTLRVPREDGTPGWAG